MRRTPKYFATEDRHRDRWLFSYTDVVTILLVLFIAVAARAVQDRKLTAVKAASLTAAAEPKPAIAPKSPVKSEREIARLRIQDALQQRGIEPVIEARGVVISLPQTILFRSGENHISADALPVIQQIAEVIGDIPNKINLVGHADAVPVHNRRFADNWELSAARSLQLLQVLTNRFGIDESRLAVVSYGSQEPRRSNDTPDGRAENRRVEIVIVDEPLDKADEPLQ